VAELVQVLEHARHARPVVEDELADRRRAGQRVADRYHGQRPGELAPEGV
jgi:hypothetical protein